MNNFLGKLLVSLSHFGAAIARDRLRRELVLMDDRMLARAGLTRRDLLDNISSDLEQPKPSTSKTQVCVEALPIKRPMSPAV